jgi:hypothetical protein
MTPSSSAALNWPRWAEYLSPYILCGLDYREERCVVPWIVVVRVSA